MHGTYAAIVLAILRPNVVQSKVTPSLSVPDESLTTRSLALEYQVGQAAASMSLAQMFSGDPLSARGQRRRPGACLSQDLGWRLWPGGCAAVGFCPAGHGQVVHGDGGEVLDEPAAPGGVPG